MFIYFIIIYCNYEFLLFITYLFLGKGNGENLSKDGNNLMEMTEGKKMFL